MFPVLETDRITLRQIKDQDAETIFACFSNHEVTRYYGIENMKSIEEANSMVQTFAGLYQEKRGIRWGIERKDTKELIGTIGFHALSQKHRRAEIGYEILPSHWRRQTVNKDLTTLQTDLLDAPPYNLFRHVPSQSGQNKAV